jgi:cytoskeleton protein RodZ
MAADRFSGDFGRKLREARERKGVSLRQIAGATKISVAVLEALERNDISRLPGGIFSRAFVRSYALEVGLDPDRTIQEFVAQFPSDAVTAGHRSSDAVEDNQAIESDRQMASTFLRLTMISLAVAIAVAYLATAGRRFVHRAEPALSPGVSVPAAAPPPQSAAQPDAAPAANGDPAIARVPAATPAVADPMPVDRFTVGLAVTRACWVSATVDGQKTIERLLQPGESRTVDVAHEIVLTAGDAGAVAMTLNGAPAAPLGASGQVVTRRLTLSNFKDYLQPR